MAFTKHGQKTEPCGRYAIVSIRDRTLRAWPRLFSHSINGRTNGCIPIAGRALWRHHPRQWCVRLDLPFRVRLPALFGQGCHVRTTDLYTSDGHDGDADLPLLRRYLLPLRRRQWSLVQRHWRHRPRRRYHRSNHGLLIRTRIQEASLFYGTIAGTSERYAFPGFCLPGRDR